MPYHTDQACHMPDQHAKRGERFLLFCSISITHLLVY